MKHYGDITELKGYMLPEVDVVTGGSPCQDLSIAGKRAGLDGARSGLFMEQIRVIKEMRENDQLINGTEGADIKPRFMVWENVPGAFSSNKGEDFQAVLEETAKICDETTTIPEPHKGKWHNSGAIMGDGWSIAWRVFDAQFWGVPQRRRRIYLVADFGGHTAPEILFKRDGLPGYTAQNRIAGQGTTADSEGSFIEAGGNRGCYTPGLDETEPIAVATQQGGAEISDNGICPTVTAAAGMSGNNQPWICSKPTISIEQGTTADTQDSTGEASGFDGYNGDLTGDVSSTLGVNCGMSTGRNGVMAGVSYGVVSKGNEDAFFTENVAPTLLSDSHGTPHAVAYGMSSYASNAMKSSNPHSGVYEAETSRTLDLNGGNPACHQGGIMIVDEICEDKDNIFALDRAAFNQGANAKYNFSIEDDGTAQTLVSRGPGAVASVHSLDTFHCETHEETASTLKARDWKDPQCVNQQSVRRLTPLECERLQGYPDGWTDISNLPEDLEFWRGVWDTYAEINGKKPKTDKAILTWLKNPTSDSAQYKALGNSVALPNVYYVLYGIAEQLGFKGTIGSLFDGIGGFPICWESICGKGTALWASEIEPFPIAVTKHHFTEEE